MWLQNGELMNRKIAFVLILALSLAACSKMGCGKKEPPISSNEVKAVLRTSVPGTQDDSVWQEAPKHPARLILQDMVDPRLLKPSTLQVNVQSVTDGSKVAFLLQWDDATENNLPGPARFTDACAVQLPSKAEADAPAPQMGEEGRPVEIAYWSASWQAVVDGRPDTIHAIYPNASVDHYPPEAPSLQKGSADQVAMEKRYSPARALGNSMAGPRRQPVQDLIAEGPGTLRPADKNISTGTGKRTKTGWSVLIVRPLPEGGKQSARGQIAFAVWEGSKGEVGARKMRTAWIPFVLEEKK